MLGLVSQVGQALPVRIRTFQIGVGFPSQWQDLSIVGAGILFVSQDLFLG